MLLIAAKLLLAKEQLTNCQLCEHRCGVDRTLGVQGRCHALNEVRVFRHRVEHGEEPELVPSHLFYTSGCDLRCKFCIAEENAFNPRLGTLLTPEFLTNAIAWGRSKGSRNLQWVGGEPTIHIPGILEAMSCVPNLPDIVWKSDFYGTTSAFELLDGVVKTFVADLKFGNDDCASKIASVSNYMSVVTRNLLFAEGIGQLIVRHLLLPGHFDCCYRPIVAWIADHMPRVKFSLRDGYTPRWQASKDLQLNAIISSKVANEARKLARDHRLILV